MWHLAFYTHSSAIVPNWCHNSCAIAENVHLKTGNNFTVYLHVILFTDVNCMETYFYFTLFIFVYQRFSLCCHSVYIL